MIKCFELPYCSFCLINFADVVRQSSVNIVDDLHMMDLLDGGINLKSKDVKRVFYHHIIKTTCESLLMKRTKNRAVVYYNVEDIDHSVFVCKPRQEIQSFIKTIVSKIKQMIPVCVYYSDTPFVNLNSTNKYKDEMMLINQKVVDKNISRFTFAKVKSFAKSNGLTYLSETYFHSIKAKNLMFV